MSDPRLRHLERLVAAGQANPAELVVARLRAGMITVNAIRWAELFSRPIPPPWVQSSYNWHPISWWLEEIRPDLEPFVRENMPRLAQSPTTLQINVMLQAVLDGFRGRVPVIQGFGGRRRLAPVGDTPESVDRWAWRHGFVVSDTGGPDNHPPFEVQWVNDPDSGDDAEGRRVRGAQARLLTAFLAAKPDGWTKHDEDRASDPRVMDRWSWDDAAAWFVRTQAFIGNVEALKLLGWLRYHSTTNYFEVLSTYAMAPFWSVATYVFSTDPEGIAPRTVSEAPRWQLPAGAIDVPYGEVELDLVRTLLGGPPL